MIPSLSVWRARRLTERAAGLLGQARTAEALPVLDRALAARPGDPAALYQRASALIRLGRHTEALDDLDRLLRQRPGYGDAHYNRGVALLALGRSEEAIASCDRALQLDPRDADAFNNRGLAWTALQRIDRAERDFGHALALRPDHADALHNRAVALQSLRRPAEAAEAYARLVALRPDYPYAKGKLLHARMLCCDWRGFDRLAAEVDAEVRRGGPAIDPFGYLAVARSAADARRCAETYAAGIRPNGAAPPSRPAPPAGSPRIRIGYLSGEFRRQATSLLMVQFFESRDRRRFEAVAFDNGFDDRSDTRRRLAAAFDEIVDIAPLSDADAAQAIERRGIDILVDLSGYFGRSRPGVLALRPAPLQLNYLGFPGTLGGAWIDYLVADARLIPPEACVHYREQVVHLPLCYQPNDATREIGEAPARADCGLPPQGFVFCCFNNNFKITPAVFEVWMRLLKALDGSVLWLLEDNPAAAANLRGEAERRGVAAGRLVFAPRWPLERHLARQRLADLFLDTLPCNAHTTASDALWAGLPLLTCRGETFAGRVAASLLDGLGLPELITEDLAAYEAAALRLAREPQALAELRERLARHRLDHPPFDTLRLTRHVEAAYAAMQARRLRGEPPAGFAVPGSPASP